MAEAEMEVKVTVGVEKEEWAEAEVEGTLAAEMEEAGLREL